MAALSDAFATPAVSGDGEDEDGGFQQRRGGGARAVLRAPVPIAGAGGPTCLARHYHGSAGIPRQVCTVQWHMCWI